MIVAVLLFLIFLALIAPHAARIVFGLLVAGACLAVSAVATFATLTLLGVFN